MCFSIYSRCGLKPHESYPQSLTELANIPLRAPSKLFSRGRLSDGTFGLRSVTNRIEIKNVRTERKRGLNACGMYHVCRWTMAIIQTIVLSGYVSWNVGHRPVCFCSKLPPDSNKTGSDWRIRRIRRFSTTEYQGMRRGQRRMVGCVASSRCGLVQ